MSKMDSVVGLILLETFLLSIPLLPLTGLWMFRRVGRLWRKMRKLG